MVRTFPSSGGVEVDGICNCWLRMAIGSGTDLGFSAGLDHQFHIPSQGSVG